MTRGGRGRWFGTWLPAAAMKHIDTEAIRQESYRKTLSESVIAWLYITGMFLFGAIGFYLGKGVSGEPRTWILSSVVLIVVYIAGASAVTRILRY